MKILHDQKVFFRQFLTDNAPHLNPERYATLTEAVLNNVDPRLMLKTMLATWAIIDDETNNVLGVFPEEFEAIRASVYALSEQGCWQRVSIIETGDEVTHMCAEEWFTEIIRCKSMESEQI